MGSADASRERLRDIDAAAEAVRREAAILAADLGLPLERGTDLRHAVALLGASVEARPNLSNAEGERLAGMLELGRTSPLILFEAYDPPVRQRFSIAHELGHYKLHAIGGRTIYHRCTQSCIDREESSNGSSMDVEDEADAFAGAFLLPAADLATDLAQFGRAIAFLAERYIVSEATLRRRLRTLEQLS